MTFKEYYISNKDGKSNCVVRSLCKILNKNYDDVYNGLCEVAEELECSSFNDIEVFETYMKNNNIFKIKCEEDIKIKDLKMDNGSYIIFCYDKKDYYHMIPIVNNTIYDKDSDCISLYVISIYRKNK